VVVATPEPHRTSRRLRSAAAAERDRLGRDLERLDSRAAELQRELDQIDAKRLELRDELSLLARFAGDAEDSPFPTSRTAGRAGHLRPVRDDELESSAVLRGGRIREVAALLLASSPNPRRPIHYQQWYELFRGAGYAIDAQDPVATFLTQLGRSPVVRRAGAPGTYALDFGAPLVLREQLRKLESTLANTSVAGESADELGAARERRAKILHEARTTERQLDEALRSLGTAN
jgi:hypothetical protein